MNPLSALECQNTFATFATYISVPLLSYVCRKVQVTSKCCAEKQYGIGNKVEKKTHFST